MNDIPEPSSAAGPVFRVWLCGAFRVEKRVGERYELIHPTDWGGSNYPRLLLKVLLCCPGRQARRDALLEMLWPEADFEQATACLNTATSKLRLLLRPAKGQESLLFTENDATLYRLACQALLWVDAEAGVVLFKEAERRGRTSPEALPLLEQATAYFTQGSFLQEEAGLWAAGRRASVEQVRYSCRLWLAEAYIHHGLPGQATTVLQTLLEEDSLDEDALCRLMDLLHRQGMTHQALRLYEQTCEMLAREELEPSEATRTLATRLREERHFSPLVPADSAQIVPTHIEEGKLMLFFFHRNKTKKTAPVSREWQPEPTAPAPLTEQRTYLPDAPYLLPKDALEDQRWNYQHHVLYKTISNHYLAPISPTTVTILDVGTGTGIWPMVMAALFPHAHIVGVDVSLASLPSPLPATCLFAQANMLKGLPFPDQQFDFTHQRLLVAAIPALHWPAVVGELVRVTRPGGWVELLEIGDTIQHAGPATARFLKWMTDISKELGFDMSILSHLGDLLCQAGCELVESEDIPVPLGEWAGAAGHMLKTDVVHGFSALKESYCPRSNTPPEVFDGMLRAAVEEWEQNHTSYLFHAAYGRRR